MPGVKVNRVLKKFAKDNNHRIVAFTVETPKGSTIEFEGCVTVKDSQEVADMVVKILKLTNKTASA